MPDQYAVGSVFIKALHRRMFFSSTRADLDAPHMPPREQRLLKKDDGDSRMTTTWNPEPYGRYPCRNGANRGPTTEVEA